MERQKNIIASFLVLSLLVVVSCGDDDTSDSSDTETNTTDDTDTDSETGGDSDTTTEDGMCDETQTNYVGETLAMAIDGGSIMWISVETVVGDDPDWEAMTLYLANATVGDMEFLFDEKEFDLASSTRMLMLKDCVTEGGDTTCDKTLIAVDGQLTIEDVDETEPWNDELVFTATGLVLQEMEVYGGNYVLVDGGYVACIEQWTVTTDVYQSP